MLTILKLIRNLFKQLKSDLTPTQLAVGVFLGTLAGLTPLGLHLFLLFTLALLFNCSMAAFLFVFGVLKPVGLLLGGLYFKIGVASLAGDGGVAGPLVAALAHAPVFAYMGFDRYVVAGGYVFAFPIAAILGLFTRVGVESYRTKFTAKLNDAAWFEAASKKWYFRFVRWILAGKPKDFVEPKKRFILLRPFRAYMIVAIPVLYVGTTVGAGLWAQSTINGLAAGQLSKALGVKVTFGKIEYSFFGQRLAFENFQLPDPSKTGQDMVKVGGFEADLGFLSLLSGRIHIEKLAIKDVSTHIDRSEDGKLNVTQIPAAQPDPNAPPGQKAAWEEWTGWLGDKTQDVDWTEVWKKYQGYRRKSAEEKAKEKAAEKEKKAAKAVPAYDPDLRWEPERTDPLVRVDLVEIRNLAIHVGDRSGKGGGLPSITSIDAVGAELSAMPGWNGRPLLVKGSGKLADGKSGTIEFSFSVLPPRTEGELKIAQVPLTDFKALYEKSLPVAVTAGKASLGAKGAVAAGTIDVPVNLQLDGLQVAARPGQPKILGLDEQTSGFAIQGINAYGEKLPIVVGAALRGPSDDPSIEAKVPFLEIAKKGLEMLGKKELQKYIDQIGGQVDSLKKLGAEKMVPLEGDFKKIGDAVKTGDVNSVQEAVKKAQTDVKSVPDAKKDLEKKKDELKDTLDLFKKKK